MISASSKVEKLKFMWKHLPLQQMQRKNLRKEILDNLTENVLFSKSLCFQFF